MGAGEAVDVMSGKEPRKSWQMRKRQERAALKEGLAEWQVSYILPMMHKSSARCCRRVATAPDAIML